MFVNGCKCFHIGKSQGYVKTRIQEHIGEVTKPYAKNILLLTAPKQPPPQQTQSKARSTSSLGTKEETSSLDSVDGTPPLCVVINNIPTNTPPPSTFMQLQNWMPPDTGQTNNSTIERSPPNMTYGLPANINPTAEAKTATRQRTIEQNNCSALACHLYSHAHHFHFRTRANVATWRWSNTRSKSYGNQTQVHSKNSYKILPLMCCWKNYHWS